jgi:hypothetical protein
MSEHFSKFKKAFHQSMSSMPQMKFPSFPNTMFGKFSKLNHFGSIQNYKWIQIFSAGIIVYSAYFYLKRTSKYNEIQHSFFYYLHRVKKLFSRSIANGSTREKETQNNIALEVKELPEHVKYDNGWFDELDELKRSSSPDEPFIFSEHDALLDSLREITPRGEIIMYYDTKTKSFNYYSNSKNIPYSTLDAVSRKYVCLHKNPSIYIDIRDEVQKGREKCLKQEKDNKSKLAKLEKNKNKSENEFLSSAKKSLFAAFKNYKTGQNMPKSLHDGKKEIVIMKDNINKFVYKGTLDQHDFDLKFHKNKKHSSETNNVDNANRDENLENKNIEYEYEYKNQDKNLSYADFKKKYNQ